MHIDHFSYIPLNKEEEKKRNWRRKKKIGQSIEK